MVFFSGTVSLPDEILVLGDMLELGKCAKNAHLQVGEFAKNAEVKFLAAYGEFAEDVVKGFGSTRNSLIAETHDDIISWIKNIEKGIVLVKGSHGMHMERVVSNL